MSRVQSVYRESFVAWAGYQRWCPDSGTATATIRATFRYSVRVRNMDCNKTFSQMAQALIFTRVKIVTTLSQNLDFTTINYQALVPYLSPQNPEIRFPPSSPKAIGLTIKPFTV